MPRIDKSVEKLIERLASRSNDELARMTYSGRAMSKSDTHLHMCVSSGVVLIPIDQIESVNLIYEKIDPDLVAVTVRDAGLVRHALTLEQVQDGPAAAPASDDGPTDLTHWPHSTRTDGMILDACDATDVFVPSIAFVSR